MSSFYRVLKLEKNKKERELIFMDQYVVCDDVSAEQLIDLKFLYNGFSFRKQVYNDGIVFIDLRTKEVDCIYRTEKGKKYVELYIGELLKSRIIKVQKDY